MGPSDPYPAMWGRDGPSRYSVIPPLLAIASGSPQALGRRDLMVSRLAPTEARIRAAAPIATKIVPKIDGGRWGVMLALPANVIRPPKTMSTSPTMAIIPSSCSLSLSGTLAA